MKKLFVIPFLILAPLVSKGAPDQNEFFERPLNCPLRFSQLANLRNQVQTLVASLGSGCTQNSQQALNQLNTNVANLEGIASSWKNYGGAEDLSTNTSYAKNVNQILGSLSLITSSNACFYDIKSRGSLPVLSDVIMSVSQFGLLFPSAPGMMVASGGYVVGTGLKIVDQLFRKKFNWRKPEERRSFLQLNCSFFDSRKIMEEAGIFNPETPVFRDETLASLRAERARLLRLKQLDGTLTKGLHADLEAAIAAIPGVSDGNFDPTLLNSLETLGRSLEKRPADHAEKWRQVETLASLAEGIAKKVRLVNLDNQGPKVDLLATNLENALPGLARGGRAWTGSIDEFEAGYRGPIMAFLVPITVALRAEVQRLEAELALADPALAARISSLRTQILESEAMGWAMTLRLGSLETKIRSLEQGRTRTIFSEDDEGSSDMVELLDYYKKLQESILGKEGKGYLEYTIREAYKIKGALDREMRNFDESETQRERCGAAEKLRFAWAQYRYRVQEGHDFVSTNMDIYRSIFRVGKSWHKRSTRYVLRQLQSVEQYTGGETPEGSSVGDLMVSVQQLQEPIERRLHESQCF